MRTLWQIREKSSGSTDDQSSPGPQRVVTFFHHPVASLRPLPNAAARGASGVPALTNPTTCTAACCARAMRGLAAAAPPTVTINARRPMLIALTLQLGVNASGH